MNKRIFIIIFVIIIIVLGTIFIYKKDDKLTNIDNEKYGNFEKVGNLGFELPTNKEMLQ